MATRVAIYGLCGSDGRVRYVGRSAQPQERLRQHIREGADARRGYYKARWIRSLGQAPALRILDWVEPAEAVRAEGMWIRRLTRGGCRLVNTGTETQGLWTVAAWRAPRPPKTAEHIAKIAAALRGRPTGRVGEQVPSSKLTEVQVRRIKTLLREGRLTGRVIADRFGVTPANVSLIAAGKTWAHVHEDDKRS